MVCQACGTPLGVGVNFCSKCGTQAAAASPVQPQYAAPYPPPIPLYQPRVQQHLRTLGILWGVYSVYHLVRGLVAMTFLHAATMHAFRGGDWPRWSYYHGPSPAPWMHALVPVIGIMSVAWTAAMLLVAYSLLTRRPWGRVLAIVFAILSLIHIPFGTALGIYTLWVLAPGLSGAEYDAIADRS